MVSVASYVYSDPLLLGLVVLNAIPCIILSLLHIVRSRIPSHGKIPRTFILRPGDAALWEILDERRSKAPSRPVMFFTSVQGGGDAPAQEAPEKLKSVADGVQYERLDCRQHANGSPHSAATSGVETIPEEEVLTAEACTGVTTSRVLSMKKRLGRANSPSSPFDWLGSGVYDKVGSGTFDLDS